METQNLYKKIVANAELLDILSEYFDFEVIEANSNTKDYFFTVDDKATIIAQDASGGFFALIGKGEPENLPVIYISSEGQAGKVGKNLEEFISVMVTCPYWIDLLKFSGNGQVSEMKKALPLLKDETLEDFPEMETFKGKIISELSIYSISNPVETLFESMVSEPHISIFSLEGDKFDSLFNSFVVMDNPLWRNKTQ
ncbi:hypothetical protein [Bacillus sp. 7884-1]|uniref:hypothetical protein n=1 Tax=Bacillus sp. 7884-1 TaxID=2021693 RepID=UPI000BA56A44|nr:hypothetical protein [Bacillus sp. 7884-1]PAE35452.1 hypothetical protein CHI06_23695 [Bacillus sp. 7884-1]